MIAHLISLKYEQRASAEQSFGWSFRSGGGQFGAKFLAKFSGLFCWDIQRKRTSAKTSAPNSQDSTQQKWGKFRDKLHDEVLQGDPRQEVFCRIFIWKGRKDPTPKISALLRKRPTLLRANFVLTKDHKRPYYGHVTYTGRGLVVKRPGVLSKVQMLTLVLGVGVFSPLPNFGLLLCSFHRFSQVPCLCVFALIRMSELNHPSWTDPAAPPCEAVRILHRCHCTSPLRFHS